MKTEAPTANASARRFHLTMGVVLIALMSTNFVLARAVHFVGSGQLLNVWLGAAFLAALLWYCRRRPLPRLIESCELAIWAILYFQALAVTMQIAGRSPRPLVDAQLTALDRTMHFSTLAFARGVEHWPALHIALAVIYALVGPMLIAAVLVPPVMGKGDASRRLVAGVVLAGIVTAIAFALWPAAGPWTTEGFHANREQQAVTHYLALLKSPAVVDLNKGDAGIVAFPSFHVLLAMMSALALGAVRRLRVVAWTLAILVAVSTLTTGWHYLTDVLGGLALTVIAASAARVLVPARKDSRVAAAAVQISAEPSPDAVAATSGR